MYIPFCSRRVKEAECNWHDSFYDKHESWKRRSFFMRMICLPALWCSWLKGFFYYYFTVIALLVAWALNVAFLLIVCGLVWGFFFAHDSSPEVTAFSGNSSARTTHISSGFSDDQSVDSSFYGQVQSHDYSKSSFEHIANQENATYGPSSSYEPMVSSKALGDAGKWTYDRVLSSKAVDVQGHIRENAWIDAYQRQPAGGHSFEDKSEAAAAAVLVMGGILATDYAMQKLNEAKPSSKEKGFWGKVTEKKEPEQVSWLNRKPKDKAWYDPRPEKKAWWDPRPQKKAWWE